ncbi:K(+)-transporting ATPase subunit F [Enemella evansiae]|nr:K(+)-transporting ATPase subunit F [Enemella evansiae]
MGVHLDTRPLLRFAPHVRYSMNVRRASRSGRGAQRLRQSGRRTRPAGVPWRRAGYRLRTDPGGLLRRRVPARPAGGHAMMLIENLIALVLAVGLLGYLGYTLLRPEKF